MMQPPKIQGSQSKKVKIEELKNEKSMEMAQVSEMDLETVRPIDEDVNHPDIDEKSFPSKISQGKKANKQNISDKQRATLAKARSVLAEKRRLQKKQKPAGTPAPDILSSIQHMFEKKFSVVNERLDNLQKISSAYEHPLQVNHEIENLPTMKKVELIDNNSFVSMTQPQNPIEEPLHFPTQNVKNNSRVQQISNAMKNVQFSSSYVQDRLKNDTSLSSKSSTNQVILW